MPNDQIIALIAITAVMSILFTLTVIAGTIAFTNYFDN